MKKSLKQALSADGISILAEIKRASPSKGQIAEITDAGKRAELYVQGGASAISVLTNERFDGSLEDLRAVAKALAHTSIPILRKEFISTLAQITEADVCGADAVLLIVSTLKEKTKAFLTYAKSLGLEAIVEVHTEEELKLAIEAGAEIIGVNQRDLSDFSMHPERFRELAPLIPDHCVAIAESGQSSTKEALALGYDAVLVGEALSRAENPLELLRTL